MDRDHTTTPKTPAGPEEPTSPPSDHSTSPTAPAAGQPSEGPVEAETPAPPSPPRPRRSRLWSALLITLSLLGILLVGAAFRFTNLRWDEGLALHPDERFLTMVETSIAFPEPCRALIPRIGGADAPAQAPQSTEGGLAACLEAYLDSENSPLNPRNREHSLFVYGSLPIFFLRAILTSLDISAFAEITVAGRVISALADMVIIVLTFFLGKRLYGKWTGLLAALLISLSVLNIQNAHFFTVDTFTAMMTLLCVYLAVIIAEGTPHTETRGWRWGIFALMGLAFGGAMACKINVASFALIIGLAGLVRIWRQIQAEGEGAIWPAIWETGSGLVLTAALALLTFRLAQPYAFSGPGLADITLEPRFLKNMGTVQGLVSGKVDYYPSHQWTERTALWFPWKNMVVWGLGLPLGLAGWAGVALAGWQLLRDRGRDLRTIVPLGWTLFFFLYLGVQFVKTMRYFLPLYPLLCIFAAHLLVWLWQRARQSEPRPRWRTYAAGTLLTLVVLGTFLWAWSFLQIYRRPVTRIAASRWIYENLDTDRGAWLELDDGTREIIPIPNARVYPADKPGTATPFTLPRGATATGITLAHLEDTAHSPGQERLYVALTTDRAGREVLAEGTVGGDFHGPAGKGAPATLYFAPLSLEGGQTYYLHLRGLQGKAKTWAWSIANEHWDDAIPMRMEGKDGFSIYLGIDLAPYAEDTPGKIDDLVHQLANTDLVALTSNRLYESIPRLPMRYPATTRYYEALFDGSLGFERVVTFTSYPTLFGWEIPDDGAEEAFSVYDHPKVIIFRRTEEYDVEKARALLTEGIEWESIARIKPVEVPGYRDLLLTEEEWEIQREGGTWSKIFSRQGWTNRLSVLVWLLLIELLGLAAFPLAHYLLGRLVDGGYLPAKALGILLLGYLSWLLAATKVLPFTRGTIALVLGLLLALGGIVAWRRWDELKALVRRRWRLLLLEEGIFMGGFLLFLLIRMGNPDLWHPWFGGEKPMDFAYLNAIIRSTIFPPYDPWFAGGYLNYYYFGHVLDAALIKLTGIIPSVAYNLAIPTLYGLTCGGVFTVVYHLVRRRRQNGDHDDDGWDRRAIISGLAGVAFVALLGNLGEYMLILIKLGEISGVAFESTIPGLASLVRGVVGLWDAAHRGLPIGLHNWYWDPSRVMTHGEINEFPFFTFLYADLHPHMIALPYTLLILTQVVALIKDRARPRGQARSNDRARSSDRAWSWEALWELLPPPWVLLGMMLILGALRCAHFWDFPTYLLIAMGGWAIALYERRRRVDLGLAGGVVLLGLVLGLFSSLLYRPFWARYGSYYNSVALWKGERTGVGEYVVIHGLFLFVLVSYLLVEAFRRGVREPPLRLVGMGLRHWDRLPVLARRFSRWVGRRTVLYTLLGAGAFLLLIALFFLLPVAEAPQWPDKFPGGEFLFRLRQQHLLGWLIPLAGLGLVLFFRRREDGTGRLIAMLILAGLGLTGGVELLVVKGDIGRMNTVFRFYFQAWVLWGIASAAAMPRLWEQTRGWTSGARKRWRVVLYILVALCALYPILATPAKINDRFPDQHLFDVDLIHASMMNDGQVTAPLLQEFRQHQISLSPSATIATEEPGRAWKIIDGTVEYRLVKEGELAKVYANVDMGPGLDGAKFMEKAVYGDEHGPIVLAEDYAAIRWLQENVEGSPVILEGNALLYRWGNRISIHTGQPTVIGWDWHQRQQRAAVQRPVVEDRLEDLNKLYGSPDVAATLELLRRYHVSYIIVGQLERYYYPARGLAKFEDMVGVYLEQVYPATVTKTADTAAGELDQPEPTPLEPTVLPYPEPATSSVAYPTAPPAGQEPSPSPGPSSTGTVIYRVLPTVWENE